MTTIEANAMLARADRWLRLIDTDDYHIDLAKDMMIFDSKEKRSGKFSDFLSTAMTDYQGTMDTYNEWNERAKQGRLAADRAYLVGMDLPKERIDELDRLSLEQKQTVDKTMVASAWDKWILAANDFLYYVDFGIVHGIVVVGQGLERKLAESEKAKTAVIVERDHLQEELAQVSTELVSVRALYEECERKRHIRPA